MLWIIVASAFRPLTAIEFVSLPFFASSKCFLEMVLTSSTFRILTYVGARITAASYVAQRWSADCTVSYVLFRSIVRRKTRGRMDDKPNGKSKQAQFCGHFPLERSARQSQEAYEWRKHNLIFFLEGNEATKLKDEVKIDEHRVPSKRTNDKATVKSNERTKDGGLKNGSLMRQSYDKA